MGLIRFPMSAQLPKPFFAVDLLKRPAILNVRMVNGWIQRGWATRPDTQEIRRIESLAERMAVEPHIIPLERFQL